MYVYQALKTVVRLETMQVQLRTELEGKVYVYPLQTEES